MKTLIVLVGPTGVGKTDISLHIAEHFNTPILNADSRQLYQDIPIGTAAPTKEQIARVHHYFVGTLGLDKYYSAAKYEEEALSILESEFKQRDNILLTGGSMMYIDAVCRGIDDIPTVDEDTRALMKKRYESEGLDSLLAELKLLDPSYYDICDKKNPKRVIHALEICYTSGRTYTSYRVNAIKERAFRIIKIGLTRPREELFKRINERVIQMMELGLEEEARKVLPYRNCNSLNTVGYKEMFSYFDGDMTRDEAITKIQRNTRVYSKKQMTWLKKDDQTKWFHPSEEKEIIRYIESMIKND